jgi:hypothetical protein
MQLHAHGAQDGAHRAGGASLFADYFPHVLRRNPKLENGVFVPADGLDLYGCRFIHQGPRNFADKFIDCDHIVLGHARTPDRKHPKIGDQKLVTWIGARMVSAHTHRRQQLCAQLLQCLCAHP